MITMICLLCRGVLGSGDVTHFQYDVAEVKLGIKDRPAWIEELVNLGQFKCTLLQQHTSCSVLGFCLLDLCLRRIWLCLIAAVRSSS